jgi:multiple sugar transport system substrate-binding protein
MILRGMTWDHSRGYDPMVATAREYARTHPGVEIIWEKRSLQAFADFPVEQLAQRYDLIVIDHPHVGFVAREGCLVALDTVQRSYDLAALARQSLGGSHETYQFRGHQWALAIDAATQVACYRPDLLAIPPTTWDQVIALAEAGKVLWPIKPVDALMSFFTLAANHGTPCRTDGKHPLIARDDARTVLEAMAALARHVPRECLSMNPIQAFEQMSTLNQFAYCPLGYGYTNYSRDGYRPHLLHFTNIASLDNAGPRGSCIGGTGIAVSSRSKAIDVAVDYAFWIASAECQRTLFFDSGGQPGNAVAWEDDHCNAVAHDFFRATRATLDAVYVRPRYDGYMGFQDDAGNTINAFLAGRVDMQAALKQLETSYQRSISMTEQNNQLKAERV